MAENTKIEWADHTFNPWIGCTAVSPACTNCYAEGYGHRFGVAWGPGEDRRRTSASYWRKPHAWNTKAARDGARPFIFCASLADVFDNEVDPAWRRDLFTLIDETPALVWLLLTKRIGNAERMVVETGRVPRNIALGATMANQEEYDRDHLKLDDAGRALGALFTFGSFEPLLGPVELNWDAPDWIIVGGESGPNAREMDMAWPRAMERQCAKLSRVFNFKQGGGRGPDKGGHLLDGRAYLDRPQVAA